MSLDPCYNFARQASKLALVVGSFDRGRWFSGGGGVRDWPKPTQLAWRCTHLLFFSHVASLYPGRLGQLADSVVVLWLVQDLRLQFFAAVEPILIFILLCSSFTLTHLFAKYLPVGSIFEVSELYSNGNGSRNNFQGDNLQVSESPGTLFFICLIFIFFTPWKSF